MNRIIANDSARVAAWVAERIGCAPYRSYAGLGIERDGMLVGGVVVEGYVKGIRCAIHCAGDGRRWLTREFLYVVFDYVFRQLGCQVAVSPVAEDNADCIRFITGIGFEVCGKIPHGAGHCDLIIFAMPRRKCRWLSLLGGRYART